MAASSLEAKALERKERLKALKRKREGDTNTENNSKDDHVVLPK